LPIQAQPNTAQIRWQDHEVGVVYHFELTTYDDRRRGGHIRDLPPLDPRRYHPAKLDMDQWLAAAKALGARYALFTVTHESGFMQWPSDLYEFGVKHVPWRHSRADPVGEFVEACRRVDIEPGFFIGLRFNAFCDVHTYKVRDGDEAAQAAYREICCRQVEELVTRYGPLAEVWIEGGLLDPEHGGPDIQPIIERHQPDTVFYHSSARGDHRWVGNEDGVAAYPCWATMPHRGGREAHDDPDYGRLLPHGDPDAPFWSPAMCDLPLRDHNWFWWPGQENRVYSLERLMDMYRRSVGRNSVLTLGLAPNRDGLIDETDMQRYVEFGREIRRRYGTPVAQTSGEGESVTLELPKPARLGCVTLMEDIAPGERVRAFELHGRTGPGRWERLAFGSCIGHKRLAHFLPREVTALRLHVNQAGDTPQIRQLAAHRA